MNQFKNLCKAFWACAVILLLINSQAIAQMAQVSVGFAPYTSANIITFEMRSISTEEGIYFEVPSPTVQGTDIYAYKNQIHGIKKVQQTQSSPWTNRFTIFGDSLYFGYADSKDAKVRLAKFENFSKTEDLLSPYDWESPHSFTPGDNQILYFRASDPSGKGVYAYNTSSKQFKKITTIASNVNISQMTTIGDSLIVETSDKKIHLYGISGSKTLMKTANYSLGFKARYGDETFLYNEDFVTVARKGVSKLSYAKDFKDVETIRSVDSLENGLFFSTQGEGSFNIYRADGGLDSLQLLTRIYYPDVQIRQVFELNKNEICVFMNGGKILVYNLKTMRSSTKQYSSNEKTKISELRTPVTDVKKGTLYCLLTDSIEGKVRLGSVSSSADSFEILSDTMGVARIDWNSRELILLKGNVFFFDGDENGIHLKKMVKDPVYLHFNCFNDLNENGAFDAGEPTINKLSFEVNKKLSFIRTNPKGLLKMALEKRAYSIKAIAKTGWQFTTDSVITIKNSEAIPKTTLTYNLGIIPHRSIYEIDGIASWLPTRCGFRSYFRLKLINEGTQAFNGEVRMRMDSLVTIDSFDILPDSILGNEFVWLLDTVNPTHFKIAKAYFRVPGEKYRGRELKVDVTYRGYEDSLAKVSLIDTFRTKIDCAIDPNDKTVWPNRDALGYQTLHDERLTYRIRFQNTGGDTAFNIVVADTLSQHLDWSTFKLMDYSHEVNTQFYDDGLLEFHFDDILLPDSNVNEPKSHGFITYTIKAKTGLDERTEIKNTAHIYFDFNAAVVTNTTRNVMVKEIIYDNVRKPGKANEAIVFPNPAKNRLNLVLDIESSAAITVISSNGKQVLQDVSVKNGQLDISSLHPGLYFISIIQGDKVHRASFVKR